MRSKKQRGLCRLLAVFLFFGTMKAAASPLYSPSWGFWLDLPEGYELSGGDGKDRFSFQSPQGSGFDLVVYTSYASVKELAEDTGKRLKNEGDTGYFTYRDKEACLMELRFPSGSGTIEGWGLCVEIKGALLLALAYGPAGRGDLQIFHLSALDSIAPTQAEKRTSGPVSDFSYPRGKAVQAELALKGVRAVIAENDAEGAQALVDREFALLRNYLSSPLWEEAWTRFYRAVFRDSWERLSDAAFKLERYWNVPGDKPGTAPGTASSAPPDQRTFAGQVLAWVQSFDYERDLMGSDFVNLVSAACEGRGDCDSRAMLWALVLNQADIGAAIMVSAEYSHAMGLADVPGSGARFESGGKSWLVAETTAPVAIGLIGENVSAVESWLGITFDVE
jgi:hypothetical protein